MKSGFPLYLKILVWFFLNLLALGIIGLLVLEGKFGLDLLLSGPVAQRIGGVSEAIVSELRAQPDSQWTAILENRSAHYGVKFVLFEDDGTQVAGASTEIPQEIQQRCKPPPGGHTPGEPDRIRRMSQDFRATGFTNTPPFRFFFPRPRFAIKTSSPTRYWIGMPAFLADRADDAPHFFTLMIVSRNLYGGGLFFDAKPLLVAAVWVMLFSVLFWFPLVRGITHSLGQMTRATEQIAEGRFDVRVRIPRRDELGQLGGAVNRMAQRLEGLVHGQKRFLGDTAHELCTPLARIQMAVGILEQRADSTSQTYVQDVRDEVQHMSDLVAELLSFSKASLARSEIKLQPLKVRAIVEQALQRESQPGAEVQLAIDPDLQAAADPELVQRAVANLLRNAFRYAGSSGPITVSAISKDGMTELTVSDCGPGVSEEFLQRLFDPFFRVDASRTRESGGVGLGLTIVRTCIEACGGSVSCRNRKPTGLEVSIRLKATQPPP